MKRRRAGVFIVAVVLAALTLTGCGSSLNRGTQYTAGWSTVKFSSPSPFVTTSQSVSEAEYKSRCKRVNYKDFKSDAKAHLGQDVYFKGPVTLAGPMSRYFEYPQAPGMGLGLNMLTLGMGSSHGEYDTLVVVLWPGSLPIALDGHGNPLKDYDVEVWGESQGAYGSPEIDSWPKWALVRARYVTVYQR